MRLIAKALLPLEVVAFLGTMFGLFLRLSHLSGGQSILMLSMSTLAGVFFLRAFLPRPMAQISKKDEPAGFGALLGGTIAPKVMMIASAVTITGALFKLLRLHGGQDQLLIGITSLGFATALGVWALMTMPGYDYLKGLLIRAVPTLLFGVYLFMNNPV